MSEASERLRVLIVEDDPEWMDLIAREVEALDLEVSRARSAPEAVQKASGASVILLDYAIPGDGAHLLLPRLSALTYDAPILIVSATDPRGPAAPIVGLQGSIGWYHKPSVLLAREGRGAREAEDWARYVGAATLQAAMFYRHRIGRERAAVAVLRDLIHDQHTRHTEGLKSVETALAGMGERVTQLAEATVAQANATRQIAEKLSTHSSVALPTATEPTAEPSALARWSEAMRSDVAAATEWWANLPPTFRRWTLFGGALLAVGALAGIGVVRAEALDTLLIAIADRLSDIPSPAAP